MIVCVKTGFGWWLAAASGPWFMLFATPAAQAQSVAPGTSVEPVVEIVVTATRNRRAAELEAMPAATDLITIAELPPSANLTVSRALGGAPGVVVQEFFGGNDQPRIQMRGSGLQQNPVERGILVLQDGLPLNRADGSYIVGFANPGSAETIEIFRGPAANRLGATVLGGALNFVSPTGQSAPGAAFALAGGSFDQVTASAQAGLPGERFDAHLSLVHTRRQGFRSYNRSDRTAASANATVRLSRDISVRLFASWIELGFDVPGPLPRRLLETDPRAVFTGPTVTPGGVIEPGPNVVRDRPRRDASQLLFGARALGRFGDHRLDLALGYSQTDDAFRFPISAGVRESDGEDVTLAFRYSYYPDDRVELPLIEAGALLIDGGFDRRNFINRAGARGPQFGDSRLDAQSLAFHLGLNLPLAPTLLLSPSLSWSKAVRRNEDRYILPTRPTAAFNPAAPTRPLPDGIVPSMSSSFDRRYSAWTPSLALRWRPEPEQTVYLALSRSFEPPTHDDLIATINGTPNSSAGRPNPGNAALPASVFATPALEAQRATTLEAGARGRRGAIGWDIVLYRSWVKGELLSLRDPAGAPLGAINADETRRLGVEAALDLRITRQLAGRAAWTFQDFRFVDDPLRGDNRLAGAPRHWVYAALDWQASSWLAVSGNLRAMPERTPVDNRNTIFNDPFGIIDLRARILIGKKLSAFAEATNLFNTRYAASTLIVDQARPDQALFIPGEGRGFAAGFTLNF